MLRKEFFSIQECYRELKIPKGDLLIAVEISETEFSLSMYYGLTDEEVQYVVHTVNEFKRN